MVLDRSNVSLDVCRIDKPLHKRSRLQHSDSPLTVQTQEMLIARYDKARVRGDRRRQEHLVIGILAHARVERWGIHRRACTVSIASRALSVPTSGARPLLSLRSTRRYSSKFGGDLTTQIGPVLQAVRIWLATPSAGIPDTSTLVSGMTFTWRVAPF